MITLMTAAWAQYASTPQDLLYHDMLSPFSGISIDTGYLPDPSNAISVRFHITPRGGVFTEMEAISDLRWPTAFHHSTEAVPGEGLFGIDMGFDIEFEVKIDIAIYQDTIPLWSENFDVVEVIDFDTLVLPDSPEYPLSVAADGNLLDPFVYDIGIITGISLDLTVDIEPEVSATLSGIAVETELDGTVGTQDSEVGTAMLGAPIGNPGEVDLVSTYVADLDSAVVLNIVPTATLSTVIGDFDLVSFPYPVTLLDLSGERRFDPVTVTHPLPAMQPFDVDGFGPIPFDTLANRYIPLVNLGALGLEGVARIEGSDAFSVFPAYFYATDDQSDGIVVTFEPGAVGGFAATLVIESNDPVSPELRIPLDGSGFDDTPEPPPVEPPPTAPANNEPPPSINSEDVKTCGCSNSSPLTAALPLWLCLLWIRRRA